MRESNLATAATRVNCFVLLLYTICFCCKVECAEHMSLIGQQSFKLERSQSGPDPACILFSPVMDSEVAFKCNKCNKEHNTTPGLRRTALIVTALLAAEEDKTCCSD